MSQATTLLPIDSHKDEIIEAIRNNQVIIVAGDTGSGKTTRLPQFCREIVDENARIGCTQPRRLAAISVAARVKEEMGNSEEVGYKIRFHDHTTAQTRIQFMTDGILLAETKNDRNLKKYSVLIIDEAHERNLNIDFLLGYLKGVLQKRPELKLIITSATIDTDSFVKHFDNAPLISIQGRTYPIDLRYAPAANEDTDYLDHATATIEQLFRHERPADTLLFLPTEKDIRNCAEMLSKALPNCDILPLFGRLQGSEQQRIFKPCARNKQAKIVVATNVAETSITVPGIRYVIDSGLARMTYYSIRSKTTSLPIQKISQASCDQRKGRCGRVGPGICVRLYSEEDFLGRDAYTLPEIQRSNLAEVLLQMSSLRLGDPNKFPFINPPTPTVIRDGYALLRELGAVTGHNLTARGKIMAELPIDPCISRVLLEASSHNCLREIAIIAAALSIQDPRIRPLDQEKEADTAHQLFAHKHSDFMMLLAIWQEFAKRESRSWSQLKKFCKSHFLSFQRMREWFDLHEQLSRILKRHQQFAFNETEASYEQIHRSLLSGFLRNIALKKEKKLYNGAGNRELMIFPGSAIFKNSGQWIMAASFLDTNRLYALTVANIELDWIEPLAQNLCKYSWSEPRWEKKSGQVVANEKVTLFGLVLIGSRKTNFARRSPKNIGESRTIFIEDALLTGAIWGKYPFLQHNLKLVNKWQETEERLRKRDILHNDGALQEFYQKRLPAEVYDRASLNKFLKKSPKSTLLYMSEEDILLRKPEEREYSDFPEQLQVGSFSLALSYTFQPTGKRDGLSIHIPIDLATVLPAQKFEWLVPGFLREKVTFLLKGLPKSLRKRLVPINDAVDKLLDELAQQGQEGSVCAALERAILKGYSFTIERSDWPREIPRHLQPHFIIESAEGEEISQVDDLRQVEKNSASHEQEEAELLGKAKEMVDKWQGFQSNEWNFAELPTNIALYNRAGNIAGFLYTTISPIPHKSLIEINFCRDQKQAAAQNRRGLLYLYQLQFTGQLKALRKSCNSMLSAPSSLWLNRQFSDKKAASDAILEHVLQEIFQLESTDIPTREEFASTIERVRKIGFFKRGSQICQHFGELMRQKNEILSLIEKVFSGRKSIDSCDHQKFTTLAEAILPATLFQETGRRIDLEQILRLYRSLGIRLERFNSSPQKDLLKESQLIPHQKNIAMAEAKPELSEEAKEQLQIYREMYSELQISIFSPEIKKRLPVSIKKLDNQWQTTKAFL